MDSRSWHKLTGQAAHKAPNPHTHNVATTVASVQHGESRPTTHPQHCQMGQQDRQLLISSA
jgi:hypothetical protein